LRVTALKHSSAIRTIALAVTAAAFSVGLLGSFASAQATPTSSGEIGFTVQVANASVAPGSEASSSGNTLATVSYTISLTDLLPFSYVQIWVHSDPVLIASGYADGSGNFSVVTALPLDLPAGGHSIEAVGTTPDGIPFSNTIAALTVTESGSLTPGATGDGSLSLIVPSGATATFGPASLVNNVSTSVGALGHVSVNDQRVMDKPGWTLHADVSNFVFSTDAAVVIPRSQLAMSPQLVPGSTEATGLSLGAATSAGLAVYPMIFAQAAPLASSVGISTFDAQLSFVAPPQFPVGLYTSTVTLTLVSK
jgi:hypothetical protein